MNKETSKPLVSVIVPIYNAQRYFHACLDSILAQTYQDLEVILVDDGSTDRCGVICDEYAAKDERVKVVHQANGGVSSARNTGVMNSTGEYIAFVDADDSIAPRYIEELFSENKITEIPDLIIGGFVTKEKRLGRTVVRRVQLQNEHYSGDKGLADYFTKHFCRLYSTVPWGKIYKARIIKENYLRFDHRIRLGEDLIFNLGYLKHCHSIRMSSSSLYNYTSQDQTSEERYKLSIEEISYFCETLLHRTNELGGQWHATINSRPSADIVISLYPLHNVFADPAPYTELYKRFGSTTDLFSNYHCSPVFRGIHAAKGYFKAFKILSAIKMILTVRRHYGTIVPTLTFSGLDKFISYFCRK